jgi:hypothetical protein
MLHRQRSKLAFGIRSALVVGLLLAANAVAHAQSCALCYTQAASASHRLIQGLRTGILVLIVPPMFMSVGITILAYKKRNRTNDKRESPDSRNGW